MNVLHVVHWPRSGIGVVVREIVRHRSPDIRHTVLCLAPGAPVTEQIRTAGARVYEPSRNMTGWLQRLAALKARIREEPADVVHSHSFTPRVLAALGAAGIPHVTTVHTAYRYFQSTSLRSVAKRTIECAAVRRLDGPCVCVSEDVEDSLPCRGMASRAVVIRNGVDTEAVRAAAADPRPAPITGDPLLVAVGRLDREKAFDRLLIAVSRIRSRMPELRVAICGDGVERDVLKAQAQELGLDSTVAFLGHVENPMPLVRAADALVCSSIQEGFALTAAEALALGTPVISTPVSGVSSVLRDGENVVLASGFQPEDIADVLLRAFSDTARLARMGEAGRQFAEEHLQIGHTVARYEAVYRDVVERNAEGAR